MFHRALSAKTYLSLGLPSPLMQVKSIAKREHSAILSTFIKLPIVTKIFVLSIFEWPFYTGFTVH